MLGVVADLLENCGIHHPRTEHLKPAGPLADLAVRVGAAADEAAYVQLDARFGELEVAWPQPYLRILPEDVTGHRRKDRKSTRLNSSHANISYAVFCLKKKISPRKRTMTSEPCHSFT